MNLEEIDSVKWNSGAACRVADVPPETLRAWSNRGIFALEAENEDSGPGAWRRFTILDVARLALVRRLTKAGVRLGFAVSVANHVAKHFRLPSFFVAVKGGDIETMLGSHDLGALTSLMTQPDAGGIVHTEFVLVNCGEMFRQIEEALGAEEPSREVCFD
jgi:hypothetical protein